MIMYTVIELRICLVLRCFCNHAHTHTHTHTPTHTHTHTHTHTISQTHHEVASFHAVCCLETVFSLAPLRVVDTDEPTGKETQDV